MSGRPSSSRARGVVSSLEPDPRDPALVRVAVDGQRRGDVLRSVVERLRLAVGARLTARAAAALDEAIDVAQARSRALRMLGTSDRSPARLKEELVARGHGEGAVDRALAALIEDGWLDEERFARTRARRLAERGALGRDGMLASLRREGVAEERALRAVDAALPAADERALALAAARRLLGPGARDERAARRAARALERKGFDADTIGLALRACGVELERDG